MNAPADKPDKPEKIRKATEKFTPPGYDKPAPRDDRRTKKVGGENETDGGKK